MESYRVELLSSQNTIIVHYPDRVHYKTLLKSLDDLLEIRMLDRVHLILDFGKTKNLQVSHRQCMNFGLGLKMLFPKKAVRKIAIISPLDNSLSGVFCSSNHLQERDSLRYDMRLFKARRADDAYKWLR